MPPVVASGRVIRQMEEGPGCFRLWLEAPAVVEGAQPGQFVNLRTANAYYPLLRRPFSYCDIDAAQGAFSVLYQVVGPGTASLASLSPGMKLSIVGPLGKGFSTGTAGGDSILCAGGIGVAPFPALARQLIGRGRVQAVIGGRTAALCLCQQELRELQIPIALATEDGSAGTRGYVTEPLRKVLEQSTPCQTTVYACGPQAMLHAVAELCQEYQCSGQLSVEAVMGCGVGACLSCVFRTPGGAFIRSCIEGPVFGPNEILF